MAEAPAVGTATQIGGPYTTTTLKAVPDAVLVSRLLARRRVNPETGCWEWQGRRDRWGYGRITVSHWRRSVHRLAASLFLGFDLASRQHVLHRCDNPGCFRPDHLFLGSHLDNMRDRVADDDWFGFRAG